jgi:hypothetical protein
MTGLLPPPTPSALQSGTVGSGRLEQNETKIVAASVFFEEKSKLFRRFARRFGVETHPAMVNED